MSIEGLIGLVIWLAIIGLIFYVVMWAIGQVGVPEPFNKVIRVIVVLIFVLILVSLLLGIAGPLPRLVR